MNRVNDNFKKRKIVTIKKFLDNFDIRDGNLMAKALPIKPENIDYDMMKIELDKLDSLAAYQLDNYAVDAMLSTNFIKEDYARYVTAIFKTSNAPIFEDTQSILSELNVEKLKDGGILSMIPVIGTIFSYDINCFIARLNVYSEELRDDRSLGLNRISLLKKAISEADSILRKIDESGQDSASLMAAMEQHLFTCYSEKSVDKKLVEWVLEPKVSVIISRYGDLADTIKEVADLELSLLDLKKWLTSMVSLLQRSSTKIFGEGVVEIINRLNNLSKHDYRIEKDADSWLVEKDGCLVLGVNALKTKVNDVLISLSEIQNDVKIQHGELLKLFVDMSQIKINKIDINLVEKNPE